MGKGSGDRGVRGRRGQGIEGSGAELWGRGQGIEGSGAEGVRG